MRRVFLIIIFATIMLAGSSGRCEMPRWLELMNQADILDTNGWFDSAVVIGRLAVVAVPRNAPERDSALVQVYLNLADYFSNAEKNDSVLTYTIEAERIGRKLFGASSLEYAKIARELGNAYYRTGKYSRAIGHYNTTTRILVICGNECDTTRAGVLLSAGASYCSLNKHEKARANYQGAVDIYAQQLPPSHPRLLKARLNLVRCLRGAGDDAEAGEEERRVLSTSLVMSDYLTEEDAHSYETLGDMMLNWERGDLADSCYRFSLIAREHVHGPAHRHVATSLIKLGQLREHLGQIEEAEGYYKQAIATLKPIVPPTYDKLHATELALKQLREPKERIDLGIEK